MRRRKQLTDVALMDLFSRNRIPDFDYQTFLANSTKCITIALAISGGGYRSMLTGAGVMAAYDLRTSNSTEDGKLGGLLQALSYIGGISGGSWLVMSNLINDFKPINELRNDPSAWALQDQLLAGIPNFDPTTIQNAISDIPTSNQTNPNSSTKQKDKWPAFMKTIIEWFDSGKGATGSTELQLLQVFSKLKREVKNVNKSSTVSEFFKSLFSKADLKASKNNQKLLELGGLATWKEVFSYYKELNIEVRAKRIAGYHLSFTDYWGRVLARRIFPNSARSPGATVTASTLMSSFQKNEQPFPIICAVEKVPTKDMTSKDSHLFEFTPYEFGSWDSYLNAFVPMKYLGSSLFGGRSTILTPNPNISICVSGFDNIGFITGTSSCLFSHIFVYVYQFLLGLNLEASTAINTILKSFGLSSDFKSFEFPLHHPDYASFSPNPFYGYNDSQTSQEEISKSKTIYLVDGGDDGQNIPFQPFLQSAREVDVILSFDMTSDLFNYPNGTTLVKSSERFHNRHTSFSLPTFRLPSSIQNNFASESVGHNVPSNDTKTKKLTTTEIRSVFPKVPDPQTMLKLNLNNKPVFFGCNLSKDYPKMRTVEHRDQSQTFTNSPTNNHYLPPLIIYTANSNYSFPSNTSTFKLSYTPEEASGMIENGYNLATYMNSTQYSVCIGCAILKRQFDQIELGLNTLYQDDFKIPTACQECFDLFCWSE
ncbi:unnamed protein product [Debaryomyces tyrocola]|nr:unnamed protein product [Debaryomyces tyrocola]